MKFLFVFIFLPLFSFAQSNDVLQGLWVKAKAEKKDGSRIVDHYDCGMNFIRYNFTNGGFANVSSDVFFEGFKVPYKLKGDTLVVGGTVYNMIGLTKDTLKLSLFAVGAEDKDVPEYDFVKIPEYKVAAKATFDPGLKDSVYQATNEFFPRCKDDLGVLMNSITTRFDKGTLKASFIIDKKGHLKEFTVLQMDSISKGFAKTIGNAFGNLDWIPARKNDISVNTVVQVTIKSDYKSYNTGRGMNFLRVVYDFLPKSPYPALDKDEEEAERQFFKSALAQVNSGNNEKAIELLNKCIEIDNLDLNAYYLRAMINGNLGKSKDACKDWTTLAGMGQVTAVKNLAKFCKN
ncbi:MAG TPA: tetratricopeptide repeat protein [Mucilaginibacter sp.]